MAAYNQVTPEIIEELKKISGDRVVVGADVNPDYSRDEMPIYGTKMPDVSIDVLSTEEVSAIMKVCYDNNIPVTCRGAGTGLVGACTPIAGGVVLCTMRMKQILEYDTDNFVVRVQPGVLLNDLAEDALKQGLLYPPDPGEKFATLGGNVSTNAGGMRAVKYGATRDYVRAMTVVLPTGEIVKMGATVSKTSSGYSLLNLIIGSEGTLGIITEATLKVIGRPKYVKSAMATFKSVADACTAVGDCLKSGVTPTAAELMDKLSCEATAKFNDFPIADNVGAMLVFDLDGNTPEICAADMAILEDVCRKDGALDFTLAADDAEREHLWNLRNKLSTALKSLAPDRVGEDITVPRAELPHVCTEIINICAKYGFQVSIFGHAGDGNLHPSLLCDMGAPGVPEKVHDCVGEIFQLAVDCGGKLSGEHGIGISKQPYIGIALEKEEIDASLLIKQALDPNNILNPGKIFGR